MNKQKKELLQDWLDELASIAKHDKENLFQKGKYQGALKAVNLMGYNYFIDAKGMHKITKI